MASITFPRNRAHPDQSIYDISGEGHRYCYDHNARLRWRVVRREEDYNYVMLAPVRGLVTIEPWVFKVRWPGV